MGQTAAFGTPMQRGASAGTFAATDSGHQNVITDQKSSGWSDTILSVTCGVSGAYNHPEGYDKPLTMTAYTRPGGILVFSVKKPIPPLMDVVDLPPIPALGLKLSQPKRFLRME